MYAAPATPLMFSAQTYCLSGLLKVLLGKQTHATSRFKVSMREWSMPKTCRVSLRLADEARQGLTAARLRLVSDTLVSFLD